MAKIRRGQLGRTCASVSGASRGPNIATDHEMHCNTQNARVPARDFATHTHLALCALLLLLSGRRRVQRWAHEYPMHLGSASVIAALRPSNPRNEDEEPLRIRPARVTRDSPTQMARNCEPVWQSALCVQARARCGVWQGRNAVEFIGRAPQIDSGGLSGAPWLCLCWLLLVGASCVAIRPC